MPEPTRLQQDEPFARESARRLIRAEQQGLRLAIACRTAITGTAFLWYLGATLLIPGVEPRLATIAVTLAFTAMGIAHLLIIGTQLDRWWIKYAVYTIDIMAICAAFAIVPISSAADVPQIIAFRAYGIYYLFPLVGMACLSLSWRLVLWTGAMCAVGWWAAFVWVTGAMENTLSWADMPSNATGADYEAIFLSIDFIGRGNRIEETAMVLFATFALALAVYRARAVFFAQVAAEIDWRKERSARERIGALLGKYVPSEIAARLIKDQSPLRPTLASGTALVMDLAGFTDYSARHGPETVIGVLDAFFADATRVVSERGGVVITYLGDGFLVTFNAPVEIRDAPTSAIAAAQELLDVARGHGFTARIGLATGPLVSGVIGSEQRQTFTVYGDTVNLAARLEAKCKALGVPVLRDGATRDAAAVTVETQATAPMDIRGFTHPQVLYAFSPR